MILKKNVVIADKGKCLKTPYEILQEVVLGEFPAIVNGKEIIKVYKIEDIKEVTPIRILNSIYYIDEFKNYGDLVTKLIRTKYSLDLELALIANARVGKSIEEEKEFLSWRKICKDIAKQYCNE